MSAPHNVSVSDPVTFFWPPFNVNSHAPGPILRVYWRMNDNVFANHQRQLVGVSICSHTIPMMELNHQRVADDLAHLPHLILGQQLTRAGETKDYPLGHRWITSIG